MGFQDCVLSDAGGRVQAGPGGGGRHLRASASLCPGWSCPSQSCGDAATTQPGRRPQPRPAQRPSPAATPLPALTAPKTHKIPLSCFANIFHIMFKFF